MKVSRDRRNRHLHPSDEDLEDWLEGGSKHDEEHIESCLVCAERVEALSLRRDDEAGGDLVAQVLAETVRPPVDLQPRLVDGINRKLQARADITLLGELLGVSWRTWRELSHENKDGKR